MCYDSSEMQYYLIFESVRAKQILSMDMGAFGRHPMPLTLKDIWIGGE